MDGGFFGGVCDGDRIFGLEGSEAVKALKERTDFT